MTCTTCRKKCCLFMDLTLALITIPVIIFDLGTDWYAFVKFALVDPNGTGTITLGVLCSVSTVLLALEIITFWLIYRRDKKAITESKMELTEDGDTKEQLKGTGDSSGMQYLEVFMEVVSFLLLIVEDVPITLIINLVFRNSSCALYTMIFDEDITAFLALAGSFISAFWKMLVPIITCQQETCFCCHGEGCRGTKRINRCLCIFKLVHLALACAVLAYTFFLWFFYSRFKRLQDPECMNMTTTASMITYEDTALSMFTTSPVSTIKIPLTTANVAPFHNTTTSYVTESVNFTVTDIFNSSFS